MRLRRSVKMLARRVQFARRALANSQRRRTFVGGAFENDFQEARAKVRRRRIGSFLSALDQLPSTAAQEETQLLIRSTLSEHAPSGRFDSQQQLVAARKLGLDWDSTKLVISVCRGAWRLAKGCWWLLA